MLFKPLRWTFPVLLVAVVVGGGTGCASPGGQAATPKDQWLAGKGFHMRRDWSSTALHLRQPQMRSTLRLSELLRGVRGVRIQPTPDNPLGLRRVLDDGRGVCALKVYFNGVPMVSRDPEARVDLDGRVGVRELDALELHLGPAGPVHDPDGCGSLLLWDQSMRHVEEPRFQGSVRGRVVPGEAGAVISVQLLPDGPVQEVDAHGVFFFTGLLPGEYELDLSIGGESLVRHTVRVYAEREARLEVSVRRDGPSL